MKDHNPTHNPTMFPAAPISIAEALAIYEQMRCIMPPLEQAAIGKQIVRAPSLTALLDDLDMLLLDGYGVLNIGTEVVPGAAAMLAEARRRGIAVMVLTNGASKPSLHAAGRYRGLGLAIGDDEVTSSRDAVLEWLATEAAGAGISLVGIAGPQTDMPDAAENAVWYPHEDWSGLGRLQFSRLDPAADEAWQNCDAIAFLGSIGWDAAWQQALQRHIASTRLLVANPDVMAPHPKTKDGGGVSREPGFWAWQAAKDSGTAGTIGIDGLAEAIGAMAWFGKPYLPVFTLALRRLACRHGSLPDLSRIAMVGDSLHTDVLGAAAAGLKSVLVGGHGLFRDGGARAAIDATGIAPDYWVDTV